MSHARPKKPWPPAKATEELQKLAKKDFNLRLTLHAKEQLGERGLFVGDVIHVLRFGFVYEEAEPATRPGYHKYKIECTTPNSGSRSVRVVVIPDTRTLDMKIITVMWVDE